MEKRSGFVTFLVSLFPGAGYMYFGMFRKGLETMILFLLVPVVLRAIWLDGLVAIFCIPVWLYTFFDTYNIAHKVDRGEILQDESWFTKNGESVKINLDGLDNNIWKIAAWALIILGVLSIINKIFSYFNIFYLVRSYFIPVIFVLLGVYILFRGNKAK